MMINYKDKTEVGGEGEDKNKQVEVSRLIDPDRVDAILEEWIFGHHYWIAAMNGKEILLDEETARKIIAYKKDKP
jgi:hypothetical protein